MTIDRVLKHHSGEAPLPEPEPETIGDWAGHTPKPAPEDDGDQLNLKLLMRDRLTITTQVFGLEPYIILRPTISEDEGEFTVHIEAGGGADIANVGLFLEGIADALQDPGITDQIAAAIQAAEAQDAEGE